MALIDTHCHIQDDEYNYDIPAVLDRAKSAGVEKMICIGTDFRTSKLAVDLAEQYTQIYAVIGLHPHETNKEKNDIETLITNKKIVGIGEIGLDYFYLHSPKDIQIKLLKRQLKIAIKHKLPVVFHVRDAFLDFWEIYDEIIKPEDNFRAVLHSYTDDMYNLKEALKRGLFIGVNGISTFTKDNSQIEVFKSIPLASLVIETDSPYLTPKPFRGTMNEPAYCKQIAEFWADLLARSIIEIEKSTTANANKLFNFIDVISRI